MKKLICFFFFLAFFSSCEKTESNPISTPQPSSTNPPPASSATLPEGYKSLSELASPSLAGVGLLIGNKIFAGLGYTKSMDEVSDAWREYDPSTNKWIDKATFPGAGRANAVAFSINGKAYVGLGTNYDRKNKTQLYDDFYEYDPATDKWTKKAEFKGALVDQPFYFIIGNKGYFGTGNTQPQFPDVTRNFWEYDPTGDIWTKKKDFGGSARCRAFSFVFDGKAYVGGGENLTVTKLPDFFEYNPATDIWTQKADIPRILARSTGFASNNKGFMMGGVSGTENNPSSELFQYEFTANKWTLVGDLPTNSASQKSKFYSLAISVGSKVYLGGGGTGVVTAPTLPKDFYEFTPK